MIFLSTSYISIEDDTCQAPSVLDRQKELVGSIFHDPFYRLLCQVRERLSNFDSQSRTNLSPEESVVIHLKIDPKMTISTKCEDILDIHLLKKGFLSTIQLLPFESYDNS